MPSPPPITASRRRSTGIRGCRSYPLPPQINPAFSNNTNVDYWNGQDATRAPENDNWTLSIQREISTSTVIEADYNAVVGVHLQSGIQNINQVPMSTVNALIQKLGAAADDQSAEFEHHVGRGGSRREFRFPMRISPIRRCSGT